MVNFSRHDTVEKAQTLKVSPLSKPIRKSRVQSPLPPSATLPSPTIVSLKCTNSSIQLNKNSYSNTATQPSLTTEAFRPFSNFSLFPSPLQTFFQTNPNFSHSELKDTVYGLKVPANTLSFRKKLEKFKLLSLSQETFVQNYLKDKYQHSLNPFLLRDYYGYLKSKIQLNNQVTAIFQKGASEADREANRSCFWPGQAADSFNKASYLCTPTTAFNESFLGEEEAKVPKMKYEDCDEYFEPNPCKNFYDFEANDRFK